MGNEQTYLTIITVLSGASSLLASIIVAVVMNFTKRTGEKFGKVFDKVEAVTDRLADEEKERRVKEAEMIGNFKLYEQNVAHVKKRIYDVSDIVAELKGKVEKIERNGTYNKETGIQ